MQAALSPIFGRLSDIVDRKSLITITPLFALVGAIISAKAENMTILIIGGVLIGVPLGMTSYLYPRQGISELRLLISNIL